MILIIFVDTKNVSSACWVLTFKRTCTPHVFCLEHLFSTKLHTRIQPGGNPLESADRWDPAARSFLVLTMAVRDEKSRCVGRFQNTKSSVFSWVFLPMGLFFVVWREKQYVCVFFVVCVCVVRCHIWIYQTQSTCRFRQRTSLGATCVEAATAVCWQPCQVYRVCPCLGLASEPVMESCEVNPWTKIIQINEGKLNHWILESTWTCLDLGKSEANHWASDLFSSLYSYDSSRAADFPGPEGRSTRIAWRFHRSNFRWSGDAKLKRTKCRNSDPRGKRGCHGCFFYDKAVHSML